MKKYFIRDAMRNAQKLTKLNIRQIAQISSVNEHELKLLWFNKKPAAEKTIKKLEEAYGVELLNLAIPVKNTKEQTTFIYEVKQKINKRTLVEFIKKIVKELKNLVGK